MTYDDLISDLYDHIKLFYELFKKIENQIKKISEYRQMIIFYFPKKCIDCENLRYDFAREEYYCKLQKEGVKCEKE